MSCFETSAQRKLDTTNFQLNHFTYDKAISPSEINQNTYIDFCCSIKHWHMLLHIFVEQQKSKFHNSKFLLNNKTSIFMKLMCKHVWVGWNLSVVRIGSQNLETNCSSRWFVLRGSLVVLQVLCWSLELCYWRGAICVLNTCGSGALTWLFSWGVAPVFLVVRLYRSACAGLI